MLRAPFYDPARTYYENWEEGPFGGFADGVVLPQEGRARFDFLGQKISYPIGIPAGPLLNSRFVKAAFDKGFDVAVYKTVRTREYRAHPWPNVLGVDIEGDLTIERAKEPVVVKNEYEAPLSITNSFGVPSYPPEVWVDDLKKALSYAKEGQLVIGSFEGTSWEGYTPEQYIDDWATVAEMVVARGAKVIEGDFSCPNEGGTGLLCFDVPKMKLIAARIRERIGRVPLLVKLAHFEDSLLRELVRELGDLVDGYCAINTISAVVVNPDGTQALPGEKRKRSGICGAAIKWGGLDMVRRLKKIREENGMNYAIVGVGGVMNPQDFKEYRDAGADVVMSATGAMWNPYLAKETKEAYPDARER
ncbi:dihydroorotate oxidase [Candidatus Kaiserbacteria bacterium]|nr:dihydroorotate oxidase [Candidatus Kaiserbacteria bacterium]